MRGEIRKGVNGKLPTWKRGEGIRAIPRVADLPRMSSEGLVDQGRALPGVQRMLRPGVRAGHGHRAYRERPRLPLNPRLFTHQDPIQVGGSGETLSLNRGDAQLAFGMDQAERDRKQRSGGFEA